jgi:tRNA threonylcarbamoyladenosine biosynthesis protein TsaE
MIAVVLSSPAATGRFARALTRFLRPPMLVTLTGELGTGKTTVVRHALRALGVREAVASPSFTIAQSYEGRCGATLHHLDLYRLAPGNDVALFAWDDYLTPEAITFVEWPEAGGSVLPPADVILHLEHRTRLSRRATVSATAALESELALELAGVGLQVERVPAVSATEESASAAGTSDRRATDKNATGESASGESFSLRDDRAREG